MFIWYKHIEENTKVLTYNGKSGLRNLPPQKVGNSGEGSAKVFTLNNRPPKLKSKEINFQLRPTYF